MEAVHQLASVPLAINVFKALAVLHTLNLQSLFVSEKQEIRDEYNRF